MTSQTLPAHGIVIENNTDANVCFVDPEIRTTLLMGSTSDQLLNPPNPKMTMIEPPPRADELIKVDQLFPGAVPDQGDKDILGFEHFTDLPTFTCVISDDNVLPEPSDTGPKGA